MVFDPYESCSSCQLASQLVILHDKNFKAGHYMPTVQPVSEPVIIQQSTGIPVKQFKKQQQQ